MNKHPAAWLLRALCAVALLAFWHGSFVADEPCCLIADIGPVGPVERLFGDLAVAEGPTWGPDGHLYFSEIHSEGGKIWRLAPCGKLSVFITGTNRANGLNWSANGDLVACQMGGRVVAYSADGNSCKVLADNFCGRRFNAPNDLVIDQFGGIYFTDPTFGCGVCPPQPFHRGVYYISPCGQVSRVVSNLPNPNGIVMSPDGSTLYVVCSFSQKVHAYPVLGPGELGPSSTLCLVQRSWLPIFVGGDGATVDAAGNLYITSFSGIQVFDRCGTMLGIIPVPECPTNVCFGGADGRTLYITTHHSLFAARMRVPGVVHHPS